MSHNQAHYNTPSQHITSDGKKQLGGGRLYLSVTLSNLDQFLQCLHNCNCKLMWKTGHKFTYVLF